MKENGRLSLPCYPSTAKIMNIFAPISTYRITSGSQSVEEFRDELTETQKTIIKFFNISEHEFWQREISSI